MGAAMRLHDELSTEVVEAHGGRVVKERGEGDALFCVFERASDAVLSSIKLQVALRDTAWPTSRPIRVRMALHVGEAELRSGDYYGPVVNRCARLRGIGHGAQIVVSEAAKALAQPVLKEVEFIDLGSHRLKDLSTPEQVFQVAVPGLERDFPPLLSLGNFPNNLPQHPSSFVGRERESEQVVAAISSNRLVTMVGAGGTGKTRLSQHVAESLIESYTDGVWLIELDRIESAEGILSEITQALKIPESPQHTPLQLITSSLEHKKLLLLLDNCEHLKASAASLVSELLRKTEFVKVLATSREPLGITGEFLFRVPSLGVPSEHGETPLSLMGYESVQLFLERGQAVSRELVLTQENAAAVSRICRKLDGIPFALELAAARARALSVEQIADRIDDRFRILGKGDTSRASRQHTLKALIDWSYELLSPDEQSLLNRLSVFVGGCSLESAEMITGFEPIEDFEVLDHLVSLVDKSLVVYDSEVQRYRLLETMRQYCREKLESSGESYLVIQRHADYFSDQAKEASKGLTGRDPKAWMDRIDADLDNFRLAIRSHHSTNIEREAEMLVSLFRYFDSQAIFAEPREQLETILDQITVPEQQATAFQVLGNFARRQGDFSAARSYLTRAVDVLEATGDNLKLASASINLATIDLFLNEPAEAETIAQRCLPVCEDAKDYRSLVTAHLILGNSKSLLNDLDLAAIHFQNALDRAAAHGLPDLQLYAQVNLGLNFSKMGEFDKAVAEFGAVLKLAHSMSVRTLVLDGLRFMAQARVGLQDWRIAAALYGLEESLRESAGIRLSDTESAEREDDLTKIRLALAESDRDEAFNRFRLMSMDEVINELTGT